MKYLKTYEDLGNRIFYLLSTKNLRESFKKIDIPEVVINQILDFNSKYHLSSSLTRMLGSKYIYFGIENSIYDWDWVPLESESEGILEDGNKIYLKDGFKFAGYVNLTSKEMEEVKEIRKNMELKNTVNKYNL